MKKVSTNLHASQTNDNDDLIAEAEGRRFGIGGSSVERHRSRKDLRPTDPAVGKVTTSQFSKRPNGLP